MKQIKVRVWDSFIGAWYYPAAILLDKHGATRLSDRYEWVPSTGLKGKDGKEIYEGDKVLFQMGTGEVIFEFGAFVLATDETNRFYFGLWVDGDVFDGVVVGNIYEDASSD